MQKIEVDQDLDFQKKEWAAERLGWWIGLVLLIAALAGVFGKGPLSYAARAAGPLQLRWERLARNNSSLDLEFQLSNASSSDGAIQIWLEQAYIQQFQIETITPQPASMRVDGSHLVLTFPSPPGGALFTVTLQLRAQKAGILRGAAGEVASGHSVQFEQVIYP
jgi:hypothetical protein